jgi:uncharacterized protein (TIGR00251 family)
VAASGASRAGLPVAFALPPQPGFGRAFFFLGFGRAFSFLISDRDFLDRGFPDRDFRSRARPVHAPTAALLAYDPPAMPYPCLSASGDATLIRVYAAPNAKTTQISGWFDGALRVRLAAPPVDGRANEALAKWLASCLGVAAQDVELVSGAGQRKKLWRVRAPLATVQAWLDRCDALQPHP